MLHILSQISEVVSLTITAPQISVTPVQLHTSTAQSYIIGYLILLTQGGKRGNPFSCALSSRAIASIQISHELRNWGIYLTAPPTSILNCAAGSSDPQLQTWESWDSSNQFSIHWICWVTSHLILFSTLLPSPLLWCSRGFNHCCSSCARMVVSNDCTLHV